LEFYFSPSESFSVALFQKDFTNPIELVQLPASDELLGLRNAREAVNRGVELDLYRSFGWVGQVEWMPDFVRNLPLDDVFLGANYAWIESEIDLGDQQGTQTNAIRPLQGQSPYVVNLSLSYQQPEGRTEATLLYNISGERISRVGDSGLPDVYEQPFGQLDFTLSQALPWEGWKLKLRLRNLLDPEVEFLQGDQPTNLYRKGREAAFSVEWKF
jgi:outer membrane receptor for ferrienterochelin and colicin